MRIERSLGVQLHPTSLPGGRLGPEAFAFVDWLAAAGAPFFWGEGSIGPVMESKGLRARMAAALLV